MERDGLRGVDWRARVEVVDNWSDRWAAVLSFVEGVGQRELLRLDEDGWLPARQNLLVAWMGSRVAGFLCFRVQPAVSAGAVESKGGRPVMEAVVEAAGVDPSVQDGGLVARQLREKAMHRALELRCARFRWERVAAKV